MPDTSLSTAAEWQARAEELLRELDNTKARLEATQLGALALFFALAAVLAFK